MGRLPQTDRPTLAAGSGSTGLSQLTPQLQTGLLRSPSLTGQGQRPRYILALQVQAYHEA
jgi:hypothetical protein